MADPRPYYRVLRDDYPVYYIDRDGTLSRCRASRISGRCWKATTGRLWRRREPCRPTTVLAAHNPRTGSRTRRCIPCRFTPTSTRRSTTMCGVVPRTTRSAPRAVEKLGRANSRAGQRAPRRVAPARDVQSDPGVWRNRRGLRGVRIARSCQCVLAPEVLATVNAGSLAQPGSGVEVANARPGLSRVFGACRTAPPGRKRPTAHRPIVDEPDRPTDSRTAPSSSDTEAAIQTLGVFIGGTETVPKIVAHGLWELIRLADQGNCRRCVPIWTPTCRLHATR